MYPYNSYNKKLNGLIPSSKKNVLKDLLYDINIIRWYNRKKAIKVLDNANNKAIMPLHKNEITFYDPHIQIKKIEIPIPIPIPQIDIKKMITILLFIIIFSIGVLSFIIFNYLRDEYDYREKVRYEIIYNLERYLEPYVAKQRDLEMKIDSLNEILPLDSEFRQKLILKYTKINIKTNNNEKQR